MITTDLTNEQYHAHDSLSSTGARLLLRSPAHYAFQPTRAPSRAFVVGSALHMAILEPELFASKYLLLTDVDTRRAAEYKAAAKVHSEAFVLTSTEADYVRGMQATAQAHPVLSELLSRQGHAELSIITTCTRTDAPIRARFDYLTADGWAVDIKTTTDARGYAFEKSVASYDYHIQEAFYRHVYECERQAHPELELPELQGFIFAAIEKEQPHGIGLFELDFIAQQEGRALTERAIDIYAQCRASGDWPAYEAGMQLLSLPPWAITEGEGVE